MENRAVLYDGVSIKIFEDVNPENVVIRFTDDITAFYKIKKAVIKNKGVYCNGISSMISELLQKNGISTHYIKKLSDTEQLCRKVDVIPLEVIVRNVVAGSLAVKLGLKEGLVPDGPIFDLCYKSDTLNDPLINDYHAILLGIVTKDELDEIYRQTARINGILREAFAKAGITLVDFKIEFGRLADGSLVMADDITPDSARFWDMKTGERLDKDRFRHDKGYVGDAYKNVYERLKAQIGD